MESRSKKFFLILITNIYFFLVSVRSGFFFFKYQEYRGRKAHIKEREKLLGREVE